MKGFIQWEDESIQISHCQNTQKPLTSPSPPPLYSVDPNDQKKTACYDIDVEVEDPLKSQMSSFLLSTANQQEIASLDNKVGEAPPTVMTPGVLCMEHRGVVASCVKSKFLGHLFLFTLPLQFLSSNSSHLNG